MKAAKNIAALCLLVFAVVFGALQYRKRQLIQEENRAVELYNSGACQDALDAYLALLPKHTGAAAERVRALIAQCYTSLAADPELSGRDQATLLHKALEYDPNSVTDPIHLKLIEKLPALPADG